MATDYAAWKKKKLGGADGSLMGMAADVSRLVDDAADSAELPAVGGVEGVLAPAPDYEAPGMDESELSPYAPSQVTQSAKPVRSGDDEVERPGASRRGLSVKEAAVLNDPRADASFTASGQHFRNASNTLLALVGLPGQAYSNPYATERDRMRAWLLQRDAAQRANEAQDAQGDRTRAYLAATEAQKQRANDELEFKKWVTEKNAAEKGAAASGRAELERQRLDLQGKGVAETNRHNLAMEAKKSKGGRGGLEVDEDGNVVPRSVAERRQAQRESALKPRPDWEPIDPKAATFRTPQDADKFDASVAAFGAIKNHRAHIIEGLKRLKAAKSPAEADTVLGEINAQMGAMASKLRDAEGLNNSDAANHAVDTMLSLTNGSIVNLRNMANEGRLPAILDAAVNSSEANLNTLAESKNLRRKKKAEAGGSSKDEQALKWAQANPDDPRAQAILKKLGVR